MTFIPSLPLPSRGSFQLSPIPQTFKPPVLPLQTEPISQSNLHLIPTRVLSCPNHPTLISHQTPINHPILHTLIPPKAVLFISILLPTPVYHLLTAQAYLPHKALSLFTPSFLPSPSTPSSNPSLLFWPDGPPQQRPEFSISLPSLDHMLPWLEGSASFLREAGEGEEASGKLLWFSSKSNANSPFGAFEAAQLHRLEEPEITLSKGGND